MNRIQLTLTLLTAVCVASCSTSNQVTIPVDDKIAFEDTYTIIWNGYSKAYVYENNAWHRAATFDYYFDVIQKRYAKEWKSVKSLHRIHPNYNGKAGNRDQTMYFGVTYNAIRDSIVQADIISSLGTGVLTTDNEYRHSNIDINLKDAGMFVPYNKIKITQHYDYENGKLTEIVELLKVKNGQETPFMKNEEEAYFYVKSKLESAPSKFK